MTAAIPSSTGPRRQDSLVENTEPPPPYEAVPQDGSAILEANFARPYEVQDSGLFHNQQTSHASPALPQRQPSQINHDHNTALASSMSFSPPSGPPPRHPSTTTQSNSSGALPGSPPHSAHYDGVSSFNRPALPNQVPAHQQPGPAPVVYGPSASPTSGQPLLNHGRILIYPQGHYCIKCGNTGYKGCDPSNIHVRCWEKYGKPYTSIIRNMPNFNFSNPTLQKPLPNMRYNPASSPPPQPSGHPAYYTSQQGGFPDRYNGPSMVWQGQGPGPGGGYYQQPGQYGPPMQGVGGPNVVLGRPPPGASVYLPGDPRIGGHLCMICRGVGQISTGFLGLDTDYCPSCRGTGRIL